MKSETFRPNKKNKRKILKLKELCFPDILSDKFPQIAQKFSIPCFLISLYKIPFKKFIACVILSNQYPN